MGQGISSDDYKENLENAWTLEPGEGMKRRRNGYRDDKTGQRTPNRSQLLDDQDILTLTRKEGRQHLTSVNQIDGPEGAVSPATRRRRNSVEADEVLTGGSVRGSLHHYGNILPSQTNFPVQYITSVSVDVPISKVTPQTTNKKLKELLDDGHFTVRDSILCITDHNVIIKDGSTRTALSTFPLSTIALVQVIPGGNNKKYLNFYTDEGSHSKCRLHVFHCQGNDVVTIAAKLGYASHEHAKNKLEQSHKKHKLKRKEELLSNNWILSNSNHHRHKTTPTTMENELRRKASQLRRVNDSASSITGSTESPISPQMTEASSRVAAQRGGREKDVRETIKGAKIQHDVDLLNHTLDDIEQFAKDVRKRAKAYKLYEEQKKQAKKHGKHENLDALKDKAMPPNEQAFVEIYQKCKFALNLIAKLGHHLADPPSRKLLQSLFAILEELIGRNRGLSIASSVLTPLISKRAVTFLEKFLDAKYQSLWKSLGENWRMTYNQWPKRKSLPEYQLVFTDGCTDTKLHFISDRPANFPSLEYIPINRRGPDYSDAYDDDYQGDLDVTSNSPQKLAINPGVQAAIASSAAMVTKGPIPKKLQTTKSGELSLNEMRQQIPHFIPIGSDTSGSPESDRRGGAVNTSSPTAVGIRTVATPPNQSDLPLQRQPPFPVAMVTSKTGNNINNNSRLVPPPPSQPPPPLPIESDDIIPVVSPSMRWKASAAMGLPRSQLQLDDVPEEEMDFDEHLMRRRSTIEREESRATVLNQMLPPMPPPTQFGAARGIPPPLQPMGNRYRKGSVPPTLYELPPPRMNMELSAPPTTATSIHSLHQTTPPKLSPQIPAQPEPLAPPTVPSEDAAPPPAPPGGAVPPPPAPPGGAVPPPPPPPPPGPMKNIKELIEETKEQAKRKPSSALHGGGFDNLLSELKNASNRPLRKVSQSADINIGRDNFQNELQRRLQIRRESEAGIQEEVDGEEQEETVKPLLALDKDAEYTARWLTTYGYKNCVSKLEGITARELYRMPKEQLKEIIGVGSSARLYSQLQRDLAAAESASGHKFRQTLSNRKASAERAQNVVAKWKNLTSISKANNAGGVEGTRGRLTPIREDSGRRRYDSDDERRRSRRYDDVDEKGRRRSRSRDNRDHRRKYDSDDEDWRRKSRGGRHSDSDGDYKKRRGRRDDSFDRKKRRDRNSDDGKKKKGHRHEKRDQKKRHKRDDSSDRRRKRDDSSDRRRKRDDSSDRRRKRDDSSDRRRKRDDSSDRRCKRDDSSDRRHKRDDSSDRRHKRDQRDRAESEDEKRKRRHKSRRNSSDSESSDTESDSKSESESDPPKEDVDGKWALGDGDLIGLIMEDPKEQIRKQQAQLQKQMGQLQQLQKQLNIKALPAEQQAILQKDLLELQRLQMLLQKSPDDRDMQVNLVKQQQVLQQHLIDLQQELVTMVIEKKVQIGSDPSPLQLPQSRSPVIPSPTPSPVAMAPKTLRLDDKQHSLSKLVNQAAGPLKTPPVIAPIAAQALNPVVAQIPIPVRPQALNPVAAHAPIPVRPQALNPIAAHAPMGPLGSRPSDNMAQLHLASHLVQQKEAEFAALNAHLQAQHAAQSELLNQNQKQAELIAQQQDQLKVQTQSHAEILSKTQIQEYLLQQQLAQAESWSQERAHLEEVIKQQTEATSHLQEKLLQASQQQEHLMSSLNQPQMAAQLRYINQQAPPPQLQQAPPPQMRQAPPTQIPQTQYVLPHQSYQELQGDPPSIPQRAYPQHYNMYQHGEVANQISFI